MMMMAMVVAFSSSPRGTLVLVRRVGFVALLSSAGVHAKQELVRQVLVRGST